MLNSEILNQTLVLFKGCLGYYRWFICEIKVFFSSSGCFRAELFIILQQSSEKVSQLKQITAASLFKAHHKDNRAAAAGWMLMLLRRLLLVLEESLQLQHVYLQTVSTFNTDAAVSQEKQLNTQDIWVSKQKLKENLLYLVPAPQQNNPYLMNGQFNQQWTERLAADDQFIRYSWLKLMQSII